MSFLIRAIATAAGFTFCVTLLVAVFMFKRSESELERAIKARHEVTAHSVARRVDRYFSKIQRVLDIQVGLADIKHVAAHYRENTPDEMAPLATYLEEMYAVSGGDYLFTIVDRHGDVLFSTDEYMADKNLRHTNYFQRAMQGQPTDTGARKNPVNRQPELHMARPVIVAGESVGAVVATIRLASLSQTLLGDESFHLRIGILDSTGAIIMGTDPDNLLSVGTRDTALLRDVQDHRTGLIEVVWRNRTYSAAYAPVRWNNWIVVALDDIEAAKGPLRGILTQSIALNALGILLALGVIGYLVYRRLGRMRDLEEVQRAAVRAGSDYHIVLSQGRVVNCSLQCAQFFGANTVEQFVDTWRRFLPTTQPDGQASEDVLMRSIDKALDTGQANFEFQFRDSEDNVLPCEVACVRMTYSKQVAVLCMVRDLRSQKQSERALREAKEAAEQASKAKTDFLTNMSHEIRTPMNAVLGYAHLCLSSGLNDEQRNMMLKLQAAAMGLLAILNDILDIAKIEAGKLEIEHVPFSLTNVIMTQQQLHTVATENKGIEFLVSIEDNIPDNLIGDPVRLQQVLTNLISNAVKFTTQGTVELKVGCLYLDETTATLNFSVRDSGIGMTPEQCDSVFDTFIQADTSTTRKFGGTGLGLPISRELVLMMGGEGLFVTSEPGKGSLFSFSLTFPLGEERGEVSLNQPQLSGGEEMPLLGIRILLVEDNDLNQEIAMSLLEGAGAEVRLAENGEEAVRMVQEEPYDVVLMDILMPVMDGLTAAQKIRELGAKRPELNNLPIIAMTANAMAEDRTRSILAGMDGHITKPVEPKALLNLLRDACGLS